MPETRTRSGPSSRSRIAGEIGDAVGRDVILRIAEFVQQLLFHHVRVDPPARSACLVITNVPSGSASMMG